jgi:acyl-coenzyme A thioesterase PaaI-like protein
MPQSLQEIHGPRGRCFGCGPCNEKGLRIRTFLEGDRYVCRWQPRTEHEAWPGTVNGGILGALFDCHSNWAAAHHLLTTTGADELPSTVTAEFHVKLLAPTPSAGPLEIRARVVDASSRRATVEAEIRSAATVTATCRGVFVAVPPGHPGYHRWGG